MQECIVRVHNEELRVARVERRNASRVCVMKECTVHVWNEEMYGARVA